MLPLLLVLILSVCALAAVYGLRKECSLGARLLLFVTPLADGLLSYFVLIWFGYSGSIPLIGGLMFGILSLLGVQAIVSPRRLVAFRLAWQQLVRKKRQTALLMAGLMIGSAIISSSLIVGDSLDATVREEVDAAWGDTDVLISGFDPNLGQVTEIPQSLVDELRDANVDEIEYVQAGRVLSTSVVTSQGDSKPSVPWFALEHRNNLRIGSNNDGITWFELEEANRFSSTPLVAVNQVFSDELDVDVGDSVQLGWFVRNQNGLERIEENFTIHHIVAMAVSYTHLTLPTILLV